MCNIAGKMMASGIPQKSSGDREAIYMSLEESAMVLQKLPSMEMKYSKYGAITKAKAPWKCIKQMTFSTDN